MLTRNRNTDGPHKPQHEIASSSATPPPVKIRKASFHRNFRPPTLSMIHGGAARPGQHVCCCPSAKHRSSANGGVRVPASRRPVCIRKYRRRGWRRATSQHGKTGGFEGVVREHRQGLFPALDAGHPENRILFSSNMVAPSSRGKPPRACSSSTGSRRSASEDQVNKRARREDVEIAGSCGSGRRAGGESTCVPACRPAARIIAPPCRWTLRRRLRPHPVHGSSNFRDFTPPSSAFAGLA